MYHIFFRLFFANLDPEFAHRLAFWWIRKAAAIPLVDRTIRRLMTRGHRPVHAMGLTFPAVLGLAAGFDKEAVGVPGLTMLGFGSVEVGTVTARPQPGNPRPRLRRIVERRALVNRMGFNNEGAAAVAGRLAELRVTTKGHIVGVNIGKSKVTPLAEAVDDYVTSAVAVADTADYIVVNVSSPNTPGLRDLQEIERLRPILAAVRSAIDDAVGASRQVPLLVKIAPDLTDSAIDEVADLVRDLGLDGVVAVNTTIDHPYGAGGLSGPPELDRGVAVVARLRSRLGPEPTIIGCGGISSTADAHRYLSAGADLLQAYTAFIYEGPFWAGRVNRALAR